MKGGACSLCGAAKATRATCTLNKDAKNPAPSKHRAPRAPRVSPKKMQGPGHKMMASPVQTIFPDQQLLVQYILFVLKCTVIIICFDNNIKIMTSAMNAYSELVYKIADEFPEVNAPKTIKGIHIVEQQQSIRLLYTYDGDTVYDNNNDASEISAAREAIRDSGMDDRGSFVFQLPSASAISFWMVLFALINPLTAMDFCGGFDLTTLEDCTYSKDSKPLKFEFGTESG